MEQYAVHSLDKAFLLLDILSQHPQGCSLTFLAKTADLNKSTAYRLLAALCSHGYALKSELTSTYHLSLKLFELGCRTVNAGGFLPPVQSALQTLSSKVNETIHFVLREGNSVVYLYKEEPTQRALHMTSRIGLRNPMYCTGVGKAILAFLPQEEQRIILDTTKYTAFTAHTITTIPNLERELITIRQCGYALDDQEHEDGVSCIAAPILNNEGVAYAAISITVPTFRLTSERTAQYADLLRATATTISAQLSGSSATSITL